MAERAESEDFSEVYHTYSAFVAQKIVDVILRPNQIDGVIRDRKDLMFPSSAQVGGLYIAVPGSKRDEAERLLAEAHENGYLAETEGALIGK
jgi:hypothetical protein